MHLASGGFQQPAQSDRTGVPATCASVHDSNSSAGCQGEPEGCSKAIVPHGWAFGKLVISSDPLLISSCLLQLIADQPWTSSRRRQLLLNFLQAKLESEDAELQQEGARGMWELSINKPHQAEIELNHLKPLVQHLQSNNIEVCLQQQYRFQTLQLQLRKLAGIAACAPGCACSASTPQQLQNIRVSRHI